MGPRRLAKSAALTCGPLPGPSPLVTRSTTAPPRRGTLRALVAALRPPQWVKALVVLLAPAAAGTLTTPSTLANAARALVAFSLVSSALYLVNDVRDAPADRLHPTKCRRPVAADEISPALALVTAALLTVTAVALALTLAHPLGLLATLGVYLAATLGYSLGLKRVAVVELAIVASGFVLRALAGAAATSTPVSSWFLVVVSFGSLLLVAAKRAGELHHVGAGPTRAVLAAYPERFLDAVLVLAATVTTTAYCLWAFDGRDTLSTAHHHPLPARLSIVPVVIALLYVMRSAFANELESPERLVLSDRVVQALGLVWVLLLALSVYG